MVFQRKWVLLLGLVSCLQQGEDSNQEQQETSFYVARKQPQGWSLALPPLPRDIGAVEANAIQQQAPLSVPGSIEVDAACILRAPRVETQRWRLIISGFQKNSLVFYREFPVLSCRQMNIVVSEANWDDIHMTLSWVEGSQYYHAYGGRTQHQQSDLVLEKMQLDSRMTKSQTQERCEQAGLWYDSICQTGFALKSQRNPLCLGVKPDPSTGAQQLIQASCSESRLFQLRRRQQDGYTLQDLASKHCVTAEEDGWSLQSCYLFDVGADANRARQQLFLVRSVANGVQLELLGNRGQCLGLQAGVTQTGARFYQMSCARDSGQWLTLE